MCAVDQKRPFFLRAGPLLAFLPCKGRLGPYGKPFTERVGPYGCLWEGSLHKKGRRTGLRAEPLREAPPRPYGKPLTGRDGPYGKGRSLRKGPGCLTGPFTKKDERLGPYGKKVTERVRSLREGPVLTGGSLTGWPFTKKDEEAYGKAWALTGNPLRGGTVLTKKAPYGEGRGALRVPSQRRTTKRLTGRLGPCGKPLTERDDPYGKGRCLRESPFTGAYGKAGPLREAPYGEGRSLREGPPYGEGRSLREGPVLTGSPSQGWLPLQKRTAYGKLRGEILPELGGNFRLCAVDQKRPFFLRAGPFLAFPAFKGGLREGWALTGSPLRGGTVLTGRAGPYERAYGKAGPLYGKPLTERDDPYGKGRSLRESPLRGWLPLQKRTAYGKLRGEILPELAGNFRLCAVDQKRPFFLRAGPFLAFLPFKEAYEKAGPLREAPYGEGRSLREGPGRGALRVPSQKDDEEAYGEAPYGEGRSLREGPVLTERAGMSYGSLHKQGRPYGPYKKGKSLAGKNPYGKGRS